MFDTSQFQALRDSGLSYKKIAKQCGCSDSLVGAFFLKNGVRAKLGTPRKYTLNQEYFDVIDTEEKAYWLGFLMADGCVNKSYVQLGLSVVDKEHLEKYAKAVGYNGPVKIRKRPTRSKGIDYALVVLCSAHMAESLRKMGITERKTFTAKPPCITPVLERHFWRGMIDGDGCLTFSEKQKIVHLVGTYAVCEGMADWVNRCAGGYKALIQKKIKIWSVFFAGTHRAGIVADKLYTGASVFLNRKMVLAQRIIEYHRLRSSALIEKAEDLRKWLIT